MAKAVRYSRSGLPPYSYVPGHTPHPISDPLGHMYGVEHKSAALLRPTKWRESEEFLYGVDLFNYHFYWESHEAWESLWHVAGRKGTTADFLKGLIKLSALAVKAREGNPTGVLRHSRRAAELLEIVSASELKYCGIELMPLISTVKALGKGCEDYHTPQPQLVLPVTIKLDI